VLFDGQDKAIDYRFLEVNAAFERHTGFANALGRTIRELVPDLDEFWFRTYGNVALTGEPARFESHAPAMGRWFDVYALRVGAPDERRVGVLFTDITTRKVAEVERESLLAQEQTRALQLRQLAEASLVINSTTSLSQMFQTICDKAREIIGAHQTVVSITRGADWSQAINAVSLSEKYAQWRDYAALPDGSGIYALVCSDNRILRLSQAQLEAHPAWRGFGRHTADHPPMNGWLAVPLVARNGTNLGLLQLSDRYEGEFSANDEAIIVQLAQLASVAIENQRLYEQAQTRAEREAVLARIGAAIRSSLSPAAIQAVAVEALGKALHADRCYFSTIDMDRDQTVIGHDYHAQGVPSFAGTYRISEFAMDINAVFGGGRTVAVADTQAVAEAHAAGLPWNENTAETLATMRVRALVNVPFYDANGKLVAALGVAMADTPRYWSAEEVAFAEQLATETREAVEAARQQQRERNIAHQLQDALQPPPPPGLPGLALEHVYRPALDEAGVGGDFHDVFPVEKGCTALVVGDLSGKGLAAASQVATLRNMVRYALYSGKSIAEAINRLHGILVEHNLLSGFATLFVGVYDLNRRTLTYVNCGQEPGLVWRAATGEIEYLVPTGPVLGGFSTDGSFTQVQAYLAPGDVFALFTDGLTDVGPNRKHLLGVEGVANLLSQCCAARIGAEDVGADRMVPHVMACLITGVDAYARGGVRDDIAMLVGAVKAVEQPNNNTELNP
jgi:GAF domain-containing protein